jgi:hypothetical protein
MQWAFENTVLIRIFKPKEGGGNMRMEKIR